MESWTQKIYTLSGMIRASIFGGKKVLDVGCGQRKLPGATGMDILANSAADTVHDMNKTPWPFADNAFDIIFMHHALEHADDIGEMLKEVYRIGSPGSRIIIQVPYFRSVDAFCDPTHKHFFTSESLDYFIEGA
jgi:SAM-dependent methyltransferase